MDPQPTTTEPTEDPDTAALRALMVTDPAARRRVFTALLRAMITRGR